MLLVDSISDLVKYNLYTALTGEKVDPRLFLLNPPSSLTEEFVPEPEIELEDREVVSSTQKYLYLIKKQQEEIEDLKSHIRARDNIINSLKQQPNISKKLSDHLKVAIIEGLAELVGEDNFWSIDINKVNMIVDNITKEINSQLPNPNSS